MDKLESHEILEPHFQAWKVMEAKCWLWKIMEMVQNLFSIFFS